MYSFLLYLTPFKAWTEWSFPTNYQCGLNRNKTRTCVEGSTSVDVSLCLEKYPRELSETTWNPFASTEGNFSNDPGLTSDMQTWEMKYLHWVECSRSVKLTALMSNRAVIYQGC